MKLEDIKSAKIKFRKFHFWSDWIDMGVFDYASTGYLLQMSTSRFNSKKFKCVPLKRLTGLAHPACAQVQVQK